MIYDCFSLFNEIDLLELRLNTLDEVVDKFVIAEATITHTGTPKPLYFELNKHRFEKFKDKIIHIVVSDFSAIPDSEQGRDRAWGVENLQRNAIAIGLKDANPDDIIIVSDLDEIPSPAAIRKAVHFNGITRLGLKMFYFFLNYRNYSIGNWRQGPQLATYETFINPLICHAPTCDALRPYANQGPNATAFRFAKSQHYIHNAGWHFSYLGGIEAIKAKLKSIAHTEFDTSEINSTDHIRKCIASGNDLFGRGDRYFSEPIDGTYPSYLIKNKDSFQSYILPPSSHTLSHALSFSHSEWCEKFSIELRVFVRDFILNHFSEELVDRIVWLKKKIAPGRFV